MTSKYLLPILLIFFISCKKNSEYYSTYINAANSNFNYQGRTETLNDSSIVLINSAASVKFNIVGDSLNIYLKTQNSTHNYVSITLNNNYLKRYKIEGTVVNKIDLKLPKNEINTIGIYKATEASNGTVVFKGIDAVKTVPLNEDKPYKIEFIGNSITCGMGADTEETPCETGEWFDQHNAYLAYGPIVANALNANYILNSVSGIGMYRNWNSEPGEEPIMPEVYENLYLNTNSTKKYEFNYNPDIVSICLGTNDLSDGDGEKPRANFNSDKFVQNYIEFVSKLLKNYPNTKIALLTSPMISGKKGEILLNCLKKVKSNFEKNHIIEIFEFKTITPHGCTYHPNIEDHKKMATMLIPFYKELLNKK